jgi:HK97 gp10 family phage protein
MANKSGVNFDEKSYQALVAKLNSFAQDLRDEITEEALEEASEIVKATIEREVPKSALKKEHAKAHIVIRKERKGKFSVEPEKDFYYLKFPEYGTSSIVPQRNFERSARRSRDEAMQAMKRVIQKRLGRL